MSIRKRATEEKKEVIIDDGRIESIEEFQSPEALYEELINRVRKYHPSDDISMIEKAYQVAAQAHKEQKRKLRGALHYPSAVRGDYSGGFGDG